MCIHNDEYHASVELNLVHMICNVGLTNTPPNSKSLSISSLLLLPSSSLSSILSFGSEGVFVFFDRFFLPSELDLVVLNSASSSDKIVGSRAAMIVVGNAEQKVKGFSSFL